MKLKIGNVELPNNIILAPMAGVNSSSFRTICLEHHAGLVCTEMISDKGIFYDNEKTFKMMEIGENEHPISMQIFGSDYHSITSSAIRMVELAKPDILDVNMGCPVNKVVKTGAGSSLLKDVNKIYDIVKSLKENIDIPVTIKIRAGWDHNSINCDEVAKMACKAGVDAIAIHGRTRSMLYTGSVNYDYIKMVKDVATCKVIGNGDIVDIASAQKMFSTGVDAIMIGRAALGNPFIFNELSTYFEKNEIIEKPSKNDVISLLLDHAKRLCILKGEKNAMVEMRSHAAWYLRLLSKTKTYKQNIVKITSFSELEKICQKILLDPFVN